MKRTMLAVLAAAAALTCWAPPAGAASFLTDGYVQMINPARGAVGATVKITNLTTGAKSSVLTQSQGHFYIWRIVPGQRYQFQAMYPSGCRIYGAPIVTGTAADNTGDFAWYLGIFRLTFWSSIC